MTGAIIELIILLWLSNCTTFKIEVTELKKYVNSFYWTKSYRIMWSYFPLKKNDLKCQFLRNFAQTCSHFRYISSTNKKWRHIYISLSSYLPDIFPLQIGFEFLKVKCSLLFVLVFSTLRNILWFVGAK